MPEAPSARCEADPCPPDLAYDGFRKRAPTALYWCGNVVIDRQFDQLGKVLVCVNAVTIQHRGRATRSIDHDTHGHRLGQDKAQAGFEGSQEAGALDEEVAIASR